MNSISFDLASSIITNYTHMYGLCRAVEDIDLWLNEVEGHLTSQDLGKVHGS